MCTLIHPCSMSLLWCESCEAYESCVSFSNRRAHSHTVGGFSVAVGAALQQEVLEQSAHFNGTYDTQSALI